MQLKYCSIKEKNMIKRVIAILLVLSLLVITGCNKKTADEYYEVAKEFSEKGDDLNAAANYVLAYQMDSGMVKAYQGAFEAYLALDINYRAIETLELLIKNNPGNSAGYMLAAEYYFGIDETEKALSYYALQVENAPTVIDGYMAATKYYYNEDMFEDALYYSSLIVERFPDSFEGYGYTIESLNILGRNTEAITLAGKMVEVFPDETIPYLYLGYILLEEGEFAKTLEAADSCPNQSDSRITSLRRAIRGKDKIVLADSSLEKALRSYLNRETGDILLEDVFNLTYFQIDGGESPRIVVGEKGIELDEPITTLSDLVNFESLIGLAIESLELESFDSIGLLKDLCILNINNTNISDISFIRNNEYLVSITITNSELTDITPINTLVDLQELYLDNNKIESLPNFAALGSLVQVSLSNNRLSDISPLYAAAYLVSLNLSHNPDITIVKPLSTLTYLSYLDLTGCNVKDIEQVISVGNLIYG